MIGFVACLLVSTALACAPLNPSQNDTQSSTSVTMTLVISPITRWTYNSPNKPGQPVLQTKAQTYASNDVEQAIRVILADNKMDPSALTVSTAYTAKKCELVSICEDGVEGCAFNEFGTVTDECPPTAGESPVPLSTKMVVDVSAKIPVPSTDWQRLAFKLREKLEAKNVVFEDEITLTY